METNTPIGENGSKELKVNKRDDVDKLINKYFNDVENSRFMVRALVFDVPPIAVRAKGGDENEQTPNIIGAINVLENGKRDFVLDEIARGAEISLKFGKDKSEAYKKASKKAKEEGKKRQEKSDKQNQPNKEKSLDEK